MFRRNKARGAKKRDDDTIALTGPDAISSSSDAEYASKGSSNTKGARFIGRRKKKGGGGNANVGRREPADAAEATNNEPSRLVKNPLTHPQYAQESAPVIKNNSVTTKGAREDHSQPTNTLEMKGENNSNIQRQPLSKNPSLPAASGGGSGNNSMPSRKGFSQNSAMVASDKPHLIMNGGGSAAIPASGVVPMTRSGWSMHSNASSAMNSENYIQSLDNVPTLRKVRCSYLFVVANIVAAIIRYCRRISLCLHIIYYVHLISSLC